MDKHTEVLACRLILAYLDDDPMVREFQVYAIGDEAGMPPECFRLANYTAVAAARFWLDINPEVGRKLLQHRLRELTVAVA